MAQLDYSVPVQTLFGEDTDLSAHKGKVLLIVNTASKCGLTPQFKALQQLHETYADQGLVILGFPCNQFAGQDPGSSAEVVEFCQINYGVTFAMHKKVKVNGKDTHPLFSQLKAAAPGKLGIQTITWNFNKFLVARDGTVAPRVGPRTPPQDMIATIETMLSESA